MVNFSTPALISAVAVLLFFIIPNIKKIVKILAGVISGLVLVLTIFTLNQCPGGAVAKLIYLFIGIFGFLISIYSTGWLEEKENKFFSYVFLALFASFGVITSGDWLSFAVYWGITGISLYLLIALKDEANIPAKKTLIILGASDGFLLLAIAILFKANGSFEILSSSFSQIAFVCFLVASFAKAGAMPVHTWIPPVSDKSYVPVFAFLPASLDKLLGIYLLAKVFQIFNVPLGWKVFVMVTGAITIICAVYMALAQHTAKKLLAYHAVSQVGYMVLGIATANPLGIVGGIFHMLNNAIYKSSLFLGVGTVEKTLNTDQLEKLGGLAGRFPITFFSMLVASFSISGIPPFNGFFSKWFIYQGVLSSFSENKNLLIILCLVFALFGSALTLASFMKLMHAIFLGVKSQKKEERKGEKFTLVFPQIILSLFCIVLGVFGGSVFVKPVFGEVPQTGVWFSEISTVLIVSGILLGILIYIASNIKTRKVLNFVCGENITEEMKISGVEFYTSIENIRPFKQIYALQKKRVFDIYEWIKEIAFYFSKVFGSLHTGILTNYLAWLLGGAIIVWILL